MRNVLAELEQGAVPDCQFGFVGGRSTLDALEVLDTVLREGRKENMYTVVCSLDVKKAFDSVWCDGLVHKLPKHGCDPSTCRIVQAFLSNRSAQIRIQGEPSDSFPVRRGVPQGSRLGPLLYNIYIGDLKVKLNEMGLILQYADDTVLIQKNRYIQPAIRGVVVF